MAEQLAECGGDWRQLQKPLSVKGLESGVASGANYRGVSGVSQKKLGKESVDAIGEKRKWPAMR